MSYNKILEANPCHDMPRSAITAGAVDVAVRTGIVQGEVEAAFLVLIAAAQAIGAHGT